MKTLSLLPAVFLGLISGFAWAGTGEIGSAGNTQMILSEKGSKGISPDRNREYVPFLEELLQKQAAVEGDRSGYKTQQRLLTGTSDDSGGCYLRLSLDTEILTGRAARLQAPHRIYGAHLSVGQPSDFGGAGTFEVMTYHASELRSHNESSVYLREANTWPAMFSDGAALKISKKKNRLIVKAQYRSGGTTPESHDPRADEKATCYFNLAE